MEMRARAREISPKDAKNIRYLVFSSKLIASVTVSRYVRIILQGLLLSSRLAINVVTTKKYAVQNFM